MLKSLAYDQVKWNGMGRVILMLCLALGLGANLVAQTQPARDTTNNIIIMDYSEVIINEVRSDSTWQFLRGDVHIRQDSAFMFADSASILNDTLLFAEGNILIQQGDSIRIYSNFLDYNSNDKLAYLREDVVLTTDSQQLFSTVMVYDLDTMLAVFPDPVLLKSDSTQLTSKRCFFDLSTSEAIFYDSVQVVDPRFSMQTDSVKYNSQTRKVFFLAPSLIVHENNQLYCEGGWYDVEAKKTSLTKNPQYRDESIQARADTINYDENTEVVDLIGRAELQDSVSQMNADRILYFEREDRMVMIGNVDYQKGEERVTGDTVVYYRTEDRYELKGDAILFQSQYEISAQDSIAYDKNTGKGFAKGSVIIRDSSGQQVIVCEQTIIENEGDDLLCLGSDMGRPYLLLLVESDSLFLAADTFRSMQVVDSLNKDSTSRLFVAFNDVRIYKENLQGLCDSLTYSEKDSMMYMFDSPILWSDTSQFTAKHIRMRMVDNALDKIFLDRKAFVVNSTDEQFFNQLKGKDMIIHFAEEELQRMQIEGNAQSLYYITDEQDAYMGLNKMYAGRMEVLFDDNKVNKIKVYQEPDGELIPMALEVVSPTKLDGFVWDLTFRPESFEDLFDKEKKRTLMERTGVARASSTPSTKDQPSIQSTKEDSPSSELKPKTTKE